MAIQFDSRMGNAALHAVGALVAMLIVCVVVTLRWTLELRQKQLEDARRVAAELLEQKSEICDAQTRSRRLWEKAKSEAAALLASIPEVADDTRLLEQVSELAKESDIDLSNFRPGAVTQFPSHKELQIQIYGQGSYEGVCQFLDGLRRLGRMYRISQFNLTGPPLHGGKCSLDLELRLMFELKHQAAPLQGDA